MIGLIVARSKNNVIGKPLPNRKNIIVSRNKKYIGDNLVTVSSLPEALELAKGEKIFVAGGCGLYEEALPLVDVMYITEVDIEVEDGDVFFPEFDEADFEKTVIESGGNDIKYTRTVYTRKK